MEVWNCGLLCTSFPPEFEERIIVGVGDDVIGAAGEGVLLTPVPPLTPIAALLGGNSIEQFQLESQLEKSLEVWLEIPYTKKKFKNWQFRHESESNMESQAVFQAKNVLLNKVPDLFGGSCHRHCGLNK